jgi:hypothetical protein
MNSGRVATGLPHLAGEKVPVWPMRGFAAAAGGMY